MAYLQHYITLSMFMTTSLSNIHSNDGPKYHKILSLDESLLPEIFLSESLFLQAYKNWLTIIDIISTLEVAVGWYTSFKDVTRSEILGFI